MPRIPDGMAGLLDAQLIVDSYYLSRALFAKCKLISRLQEKSRGMRGREREREEDGEEKERRRGGKERRTV